MAKIKLRSPSLCAMNSKFCLFIPFFVVALSILSMGVYTRNHQRGARIISDVYENVPKGQVSKELEFRLKQISTVEGYRDLATALSLCSIFTLYFTFPNSRYVGLHPVWKSARILSICAVVFSNFMSSFRVKI